MACERCGYTGAYTSHYYPRCNPTNKQFIDPNAGKAGEKLGEGVADLLFWLAGNKYLAFLWFWLAWVMGSVIIGIQTEIISADVEEDSPGWFVFFATMLPIILAFFLRKPIQRYIPMILTTIVGFGLTALYVGFIGLICYMAYKMLT